MAFQRELHVELRIFRLVRWPLCLELFLPASPDGSSAGLSKSSSDVTSSSLTLPQQSSPWDTDHAFAYIIIYTDCIWTELYIDAIQSSLNNQSPFLCVCVCIHIHRINGIHCFKKSPFGEEVILGSPFKYNSLWSYGRRVGHKPNSYSPFHSQCALS